jgi:hypothetical protein
MKPRYFAAAAMLALLAGQADAASILNFTRIDLGHSKPDQIDSAELKALRDLTDITAGVRTTVDILPDAFAGALPEWTATLYTGTLNVAVGDDYSFDLGLTKKVSGGYVKIDGNRVDLTAFNASGSTDSGAGAWLASGAHSFEAFFVQKNGTGGGAFTARASGANAASLTFSPAAVAAVPEPASWALMMAGFALVGGAARYRRRNTAVTYA